MSTAFVARRCIAAPAAPPAVGPYTHAVASGDLLFCAGALPPHPDTPELFAEPLAALPKNARVGIDAIVAVG